MEAAAGRGRGRGRTGVVGEGEMSDLRRPHLPPDLTLLPDLTHVTLPDLTNVHPQVQGHPVNLALPPQLQQQQQQHQHQQHQHQHQQHAQESRKTSSLSAEAPEFVPRTFVQPQPQQQQPQQPVQVHLQKNSHNLQQIQLVSNTMVPQPQMQYMCHPVVLQVNNLVVQLTLKPNRFDQIARQLTAIFSWQVQDEFLMRELITVIFEQGVGEVNFRYNGARLCQHLGKNVTQSYNGPTFRSLLLQRCQEEFEAREMYLHNESERVCGYTLFLAELFVQLVTVNGRPYDILRGALCHLLTTLLSRPTDPNLKCVAQVLKCTGNTLDCTNRAEMDQVMCSVKDVAMTAPVSSSTRSLLLSVIELRASNWGCGPPTPDQTPSNTPTHSNIPLGTVYYGPGGIIQRVEDDPEDSASDTDDYINYGWSPAAVEELEGDVAEAFEEFLRLQH